MVLASHVMVCSTQKSWGASVCTDGRSSKTYQQVRGQKDIEQYEQNDSICFQKLYLYIVRGDASATVCHVIWCGVIKLLHPQANTAPVVPTPTADACSFLHPPALTSGGVFTCICVIIMYSLSFMWVQPILSFSVSCPLIHYNLTLKIDHGDFQSWYGWE